MTPHEASLSRIIAFLRDKISETSDPEERDHLMRHRLEVEYDLQNPFRRIAY